jgi:hypothetical protein
VSEEKPTLKGTKLILIEISDPNGDRLPLSIGLPDPLLVKLSAFLEKDKIVPHKVVCDEPNFYSAYFEPESAKKIQNWLTAEKIVNADDLMVYDWADIAQTSRRDESDDCSDCD